MEASLSAAASGGGGLGEWRASLSIICCLRDSAYIRLSVTKRSRGRLAAERVSSTRPEPETGLELFGYSRAVISQLVLIALTRDVVVNAVASQQED